MRGHSINVPDRTSESRMLFDLSVYLYCDAEALISLIYIFQVSIVTSPRYTLFVDPVFTDYFVLYNFVLAVFFTDFSSKIFYPIDAIHTVTLVFTLLHPGNPVRVTRV